MDPLKCPRCGKVTKSLWLALDGTYVCWKCSQEEQPSE